MDIKKEIAIQSIIQMAVKTENMCLKKDTFGLLFGNIVALCVVPMVLPLIFWQYKEDLKFAIKYFILTIHAAMCSIITLPLIYIDIAKVGAISMWYADKTYQLFKGGEKLKVADEKGELYEFDEDRYEAWLRKAIAA